MARANQATLNRNPIAAAMANAKDGGTAQAASQKIEGVANDKHVEELAGSVKDFLSSRSSVFDALVSIGRDCLAVAKGNAEQAAADFDADVAETRKMLKDDADAAGYFNAPSFKSQKVWVRWYVVNGDVPDGLTSGAAQKAYKDRPDAKRRAPRAGGNANAGVGGAGGAGTGDANAIHASLHPGQSPAILTAIYAMLARLAEPDREAAWQVAHDAIEGFVTERIGTSATEAAGSAAEAANTMPPATDRKPETPPKVRGGRGKGAPTATAGA